MPKILSIIQMIIAACLVVSVLLQSRGGGLSTAFGGSGESYGTRRGMEKSIHIITIILAVLFLGLGVARLMIGQ